jgi:hypothetical protein
LVLSLDNQIEEVFPFECQLTPNVLFDFSRTHARGRRFRFVQQADLTEAQLSAIVSELVGPRRAAGADTDKVGETVANFESSLNPFAAMRTIADAISKWLTR